MSNVYGMIVLITNYYAGEGSSEQKSPDGGNDSEKNSSDDEKGERQESAVLPEPARLPAVRRIPECLDTPRMKRYWKVCIEQAWVDEDLHLLLRKSEGSLLAHRMAEVNELDVFWPHFELLWGLQYLRQTYHDAIDEKSLITFNDKLIKFIR